MLLPHGQLAHRAVHGHVKAVLLGNFFQFFIVVLQRDVSVDTAQDNIFRSGVGGHQREVLLDHGDAPGHGIGGILDLHLLAADENFTLIQAI